MPQARISPRGLHSRPRSRAASFADEGFALCWRHSEAAKDITSICGGAAAKTVLHPRNALCFFPRTPFHALRKERFHALLPISIFSTPTFAIKHHQWVGVRDGRVAYIGSVPPAPDERCLLRRDLRRCGPPAHAGALQCPRPRPHDAFARLCRELAAAALARGEVLPLRGQDDRRGLLLGHGARLRRDGTLRRGQFFGHVLRNRGALSVRCSRPE